jgi:hypothetical protein
MVRLIKKMFPAGSLPERAMEGKVLRRQRLAATAPQVSVNGLSALAVERAIVTGEDVERQPLLGLTNLERDCGDRSGPSISPRRERIDWRQRAASSESW